MSITAEQKKTRLSYLGSSDAPAVLGCDPYRSAADVWIEKTGRVEGFAGNEHTDRGNLLEPALLSWAMQEIGHPFERDIMKIDPDGLRAANFDGISDFAYDGFPVGARFIVEAKTSVNADEWGENGTDQVPDRVLVQVAHQFGVAGPAYRTAYVACLLPGYRSFDFRLYPIPRNDDLVRVVAEAGAAFMRDFVLADRQPSDFRPSLEVLKRMRRNPNKCTTVADELVDAWIVAKAAAARAKDEAEEAQAAILAALGDCEGGICTAGQLTYMEVHRKAYAVEEATYRQLRLKAAKGLSPLLPVIQRP